MVKDIIPMAFDGKVYKLQVTTPCYLNFTLQPPVIKVN